VTCEQMTAAAEGVHWATRRIVTSKSMKMKELGKLSCFVLVAALFATVNALLWGSNSKGSEKDKSKKNALQIITDSGTVEGKDEGTVRAFLGIPYAAPPVGNLRWKAPTPATKWTAVRPAKEFGSHCMQPKLYADMIFRDPGGSEDCLTLNVWTAASAAKEKLPVMVWVYGGGFMTGGTSEARQDGSILAKRNVVVVSMNYRLGVFGFFVHSGLATESGRNSSGNYGLLDQVAALDWVQRNIAAFGGDPANVTIFGESAGSFSVCSLMASPLAKGLFGKVIGESGGAFFSRSLGYKTLTEREEQDAAFAKTALQVQTIEELRAVPADKLLEAASKVGHPDEPAFDPDVDGYFLPESVPAIFAAGKQNDVRLMAGWNHDEGSFAVIDAAQKPTVGSAKEVAKTLFPDKAEEFLKLYPAATDEEAARSNEDYEGDKFIAWSTWKWMEAQLVTGKQPVHRYRFDLAPPTDPNHPAGSGAYHSAEIAYVFGVFDLMPDIPWRAEDRELSNQMQGYWTNFARNGDPNGPGLPQWPVYNAESGSRVMYLKPQPAADKDPIRDRYVFLDQAWAK
jgi:para-nitrobenzyl esterase